jgi:hypothetical protein
MQLKMAYLIMASVAVAIIALLYGISPTWYASTFLGITSLNPNIAHILRAVTGLSFGFGSVLALLGLQRQIQKHGRSDDDPICGRARGGPVCKLDPRWSTRTGAIALWGDGISGRSNRLLGPQASREAMTTVQRINVALGTFSDIA